MTLESTVICVDNSEYARNGDFTPSRLGAQQDILNTVARAKLRMNPENNVALLAFGGSKPRLVNTLTPDTNRILSGFAELTYEGSQNNFATGLRTAHLALKHRISKNHRQRIVVFLCSPLLETEAELVKLAKKLKKENVNIDVINFGENNENNERLAKFIETLNGKNTTEVKCHLVNVSAGTSLNEAIRQSAICGEQQQAMPVDSGNPDDWMNDPNMDPELAMALRISLEESRARQQQDNTNDNNQPQVPETVQEVQNETPEIETAESTGEDELLMQALQMSLANEGVEAEDKDDDEEGLEEADEMDLDNVDFSQLTEEQQIEFALQMSMRDAAKEDEDKDMKE